MTRFRRAPPSALDRDGFLARYGGVYEHSPWIAAAVWDAGHASDDAETLADAMARTVAAAGRDAKLALLRAHPDLAGRLALAGALTTDSAREQSGAGLDRCSPEELAEFTRLNTAYVTRFGFPFIIAVRGLDRAAILDAFRRRVANPTETEFAEALAQVDRIARLRLLALAAEPPALEIAPEPLTAEAFAPFGAVIEAAGPSRLINEGFTDRFHALARTEPGAEGAAILSIFRGRPRPPTLGVLERHPLASQAFVPLGGRPWLIAVAEPAHARPTAADIRLFAARGDQGAQYAAGVWHHPLLVIGGPQDFLVVDREGPGPNLEEIALDPPALMRL